MLRLPRRNSSQSASTSSSSLRDQVRSDPRKKILGELLGQRRSALRDAALAQVRECRADHAHRIEAPMLEEATVLGCDDSIDEVTGQQVDRHVGVAAAPSRSEASRRGQARARPVRALADAAPSDRGCGS